MNLFEEYVQGYDLEDPLIVRKYKHTLRVGVLCEIIAKEIGLSKEEIALAKLCGLYHDIARFEQAKRFRSFDDLSTIDHGDLGYKIFLNEFADKLGLSEKDKMIVAKSILYHNKLKAQECDETELLYTNIVRDADKIDILYQYSTSVGLLHDEDGEISPQIHSDFLAHRELDHTKVKSQRDNNLLFLAFIWDINFECSLKLIRENRYYDKLEKILNNSIYDQYFEVIRKYLKER